MRFLKHFPSILSSSFTAISVTLKNEGLTRNMYYARFFSSGELRPYYATGGQSYPSLRNPFPRTHRVKSLTIYTYEFREIPVITHTQSTLFVKSAVCTNPIVINPFIHYALLAEFACLKSITCKWTFVFQFTIDKKDSLQNHKCVYSLHNCSEFSWVKLTVVLEK